MSVVPSVPPLWTSASQLRHEFNKVALEQQLTELRNSFIQAVILSGFDSEIAAGLVSDHLIGWKKPNKGQVALYASPDVIERIREEKARTRPPPGWSSASALRRSGAKRTKISNAQIDSLKLILINDLKLIGYEDTVAESVVEDKFIRKCKPPRGPLAPFASPEAVRLLLDMEFSVKSHVPLEATDSSGPSSESFPSDQLAELFLSATRKLEQRGDIEQAVRIYRIIAQEFHGTVEANRADQLAARLRPFSERKR